MPLKHHKTGKGFVAIFESVYTVFDLEMSLHIRVYISTP